MLDESMHKSAVSFDSCGGGNEGKEVVIDVLANNPREMDDREWMATLSMVAVMVGMTWSSVADPYGL